MALLQVMFASCFKSRAAEKQALKFWDALYGTVLSGTPVLTETHHPGTGAGHSPAGLDHRGRTHGGCL